MGRGTAPTDQADLSKPRGEKTEIIKLEVPADFKYLDAITNLISLIIERMETPLSDANAKFSITLAIHEACTNIIEHAYHGNPGQIQISIEIDAQQSMTIELIDQGDPAILERIQNTEPRFPQIKGYGLFLIRQLVDQIQYSREGNSNHWQITKQL